MGIIDRITSIAPRRREYLEPRNQTQTLRDEFDRWLQGVSEDWSRMTSRAGGLRWMPATDVHESEREVVVTVEVPGLERDDLQLTLTPEGLVIRGERREEKEDRRRGLLFSELHYGSFVRTVPLPSGLDLDAAEARAQKGVLTVRFPRKERRADARRIPIEETS
jgi:HSP20 family protein